MATALNSNESGNAIEFPLLPDRLVGFEPIPPPLPAKPNKDYETNLADNMGYGGTSQNKFDWDMEQQLDSTCNDDDELLIKFSNAQNNWIADFDDDACSNLKKYMNLTDESKRSSSFSSESVASSFDNDQSIDFIGHSPEKLGYVCLDDEGDGILGEKLYALESKREHFLRDIYLKMQSSTDVPLSASVAHKFFTKSGLSEMDLSRLWSLLDWDASTFMTYPQFIVAMQIVTVSQQNSLPFPASLPEALRSWLSNSNGWNDSQYSLNSMSNSYSSFHKSEDNQGSGSVPSDFNLYVGYNHRSTCSSSSDDDDDDGDDDDNNDDDDDDDGDDDSCSRSDFTSKHPNNHHIDYFLLMESNYHSHKSKKTRRNSLQVGDENRISGFGNVRDDDPSETMHYLPQSNSDHQTLHSKTSTTDLQILTEDERQTLQKKLKSQKQRNYILLRLNNELDNELREVTEQYFYLNMRYQKLYQSTKT